jgi:hypothetical protein
MLNIWGKSVANRVISWVKIVGFFTWYVYEGCVFVFNTIVYTESLPILYKDLSAAKSAILHLFCKIFYTHSTAPITTSNYLIKYSY